MKGAQFEEFVVFVGRYGYSGARVNNSLAKYWAEVSTIGFL
jgi:hypothetical protein